MRHPVRAALLGFAILAPGSPAQSPADPLERLATVAVRESTATGTPVTCVDAVGKPIAGALVAVLGSAPKASADDAALTAEVVRYIDDPRRQAAAIALARGEFWRTDDTGTARVSVPGDVPTMMHAFGAAAHAASLVQPGSKTVRFVLRPPRQVEVTVVDDAGKPAAGVPVGIATDGTTWGRATTDAKGVAVLDEPERPGAAPAKWSVGIAAPLAKHVDADVEWPAEGRATAKLTAPPLGSVRVIVYGADEKPHLGVERVFLRDDGNRVHHRPVATEPSGATFCVGLGLELDIGAKLRGVDGELTLAAKGPTHARELVVVDLRRTVGPPTLSFRLLGLDGAPVPAEEIGVAFVRLPKHFDLQTGHTAADGTVSIAVEDPFAGHDFTMLVVRRGPDADLWRGALDLAVAKWDGGDRKLGDLRLQPEPLFARGKVVDAAGKPIAGAGVFPQFARGEGSHSATGSSGRFFMPTVETGADGTFELRCILPATGGTAVACRRSAKNAFLQPMPDVTVPMRTGDTDVVVELR